MNLSTWTLLLPKFTKILKRKCFLLKNEMSLRHDRRCHFFGLFVAGYFLGSSRRGGEVRKGGVESLEAEFGHLRETLRALHRAQGETVDTQRMDELLSLDAVASDETKRSKRSRLLSDLNAWGWAELKRPVVVREKDDEDRRRTLYQVAPFNLPSWLK